jgi:hypothetical protein
MPSSLPPPTPLSRRPAHALKRCAWPLRNKDSGRPLTEAHLRETSSQLPDTRPRTGYATVARARETQTPGCTCTRAPPAACVCILANEIKHRVSLKVEIALSLSLSLSLSLARASIYRTRFRMRRHHMPFRQRKSPSLLRARVSLPRHGPRLGERLRRGPVTVPPRHVRARTKPGKKHGGNRLRGQGGASQRCHPPISADAFLATTRAATSAASRRHSEGSPEGSAGAVRACIEPPPTPARCIASPLHSRLTSVVARRHVALPPAAQPRASRRRTRERRPLVGPVSKVTVALTARADREPRRPEERCASPAMQLARY